MLSSLEPDSTLLKDGLKLQEAKGHLLARLFSRKSHQAAGSKRPSAGAAFFPQEPSHQLHIDIISRALHALLQRGHVHCEARDC